MTIERLRQQGLSMAEMMFAMLLLFLVGVFVMDMFVGGSRQLVKATKNERLSGLLRAKVSEVRLTDYAVLNSLTLSGSFPPPDDAYEYQIQYLDFPPYDQAEVRTVQVTVTHPKLGTRNSRFVRSLVPVEPGKAVFEKFACATCHAIPAAGFPVQPGTLLRLDQIGTTGPPRPFQGSPPSMTFEEYVQDSIVNPGSFDAIPTDSPDAVMTPVNVEGISATFDPAYDMSAQEMSDLASWLATFNP